MFWLTSLSSLSLVLLPFSKQHFPPAPPFWQQPDDCWKYLFHKHVNVEITIFLLWSWRVNMNLLDKSSVIRVIIFQGCDIFRPIWISGKLCIKDELNTYLAFTKSLKPVNNWSVACAATKIPWKIKTKGHRLTQNIWKLSRGATSWATVLQL